MGAAEQLGILSLAVLALGPVGVVTLLGCLVLALRGWRVPTVVWALPGILAVTLGLGGSRLELGLVLQAVAGADPWVATSLAAAGTSIALQPALLGSAVGGLLALAAAWLLALVPLLRRAPGTRWSPGHALVPALIAVVGAPLLARFAGPLGALVVLLGAAPCVLAALRCATREARGEPDGRAVVAGRFGVVALAVMGALPLAQAVRVQAASAAFHAVGHAAASTKAELLAAVGQQHQSAATVLAALVVLVAGVAILAPVARAWDRRAAVGAALLLIAVAPSFGARALLLERLDELRELTRPWYHDRVEQLAAQGLDLPVSSARRRPEPALTLSASPAGLQLGARAILWEGERRDGLHWPLFEALDGHAVRQSDLGGDIPMDFAGTLLLQLHRELRWEQIEPLLRAVAGARFVTLHAAVAHDGELRILELDLDGPVHPLAGSSPPVDPSEVVREPGVGRVVTLMLGGGEAREPVLRLEALDGVWRIVAPGMEPELARDTAQLAEAARRIKDEYPDEDVLRVVPVPSTRWAELVSALDAVRGQGEDGPVFPFARIRLEPPQPPAPQP